jgi:murein DD-endopeptidase MepM/ murein hydrolase activator NlpD
MKNSQEIDQQLTKQVPEAQMRNSKAMVCLALSMGATTTLLPEHAVAKSLLSYVNNEQTFSLAKQPKLPLITSGETNKSLILVKKPKQLTGSSSPLKINKPQKIKELNENLSSNQVLHIVKFGDTINEIAAHYQVLPQELVKVNRLLNPEVIEVNQRLIIPSRPSKVVQTNPNHNPTNPNLTRLRAEILRLRQEHQTQSHQVTQNNPVQLISAVKSESEIKQELPASLVNFREDVAKLRKSYQKEQETSTPILVSSKSTQLLATETEMMARQPNIPELPPLLPPEEYLPESPQNIEVFDGYIWPAKGVFTSGYGWRWGRLHAGIDIAGPIGTPIYAAAPGEVIYAGWQAYGYGNLVKIQHHDGSVTVYGHNNRLLVRPGQKVEQGEQISEMGSTGYSTGPHLHFEIHPREQGAVNPLAYLPAR